MHRLTRPQSLRAERLSEQHTTTELGQMHVGVNGKQGEILAWAIYLRSCADRAASGNPVPTAGYSGRQTNKR
jgi:hypothetical protein